MWDKQAARWPTQQHPVWSPGRAAECSDEASVVGVCRRHQAASSCVVVWSGRRVRLRMPTACVDRLPGIACRLLATGGMDTLICIWDLQQAVPGTIIYRPDEPVRALSFSADTALLAYCQEDVPGQPSSVEVMDTKTGAQAWCWVWFAHNPMLLATQLAV